MLEVSEAGEDARDVLEAGTRVDGDDDALDGIDDSKPNNGGNDGEMGDGIDGEIGDGVKCTASDHTLLQRHLEPSPRTP
jgi:hypothetical protein